MSFDKFFSWFLLVSLLSNLISSISASSPPLGWNSWDAYRREITEAYFRAETQQFANLLKQYGWEYVVIDGGWDSQTDGHCRTIPDLNNWPSSKNGVGLKAVGDFVHGLGLKFGLHLMRGLSGLAVQNNEPILGTNYRAQDIVNNDYCEWSDSWKGINMSHPGGKAYYASLVQQMVEWGIDFIKVDCIGIGRDQHNQDILAIADAIKKSGREIIFSLSPGVSAEPNDLTTEILSNIDMYRITNDLWDCWNTSTRNENCGPGSVTVSGAWDFFPRWQKFIGQKGLHNASFPDGDMIPIGELASGPSSLNYNESRSLMTLWSIFRNPLMFGGRLTKISQPILELLTNPEVIEINQRSHNNRQVRFSEGVSLWVAEHQISDITYVAISNLNKGSNNVQFSFKEVGRENKTCQVRDLWEKRDLGRINGQVTLELYAHDSRLFKLYNCT